MGTNFTDLTDGQAANEVTFNAPLTELDNAIEAAKLVRAAKITAGAQSIGTASVVLLAFTATTRDENNLATINSGTSDDGILLDRVGWWLVTYTVLFVGGTGNLFARVKYGTSLQARHSQEGVSGLVTNLTGAELIYATGPTTKAQLECRQDTGGSLSLPEARLSALFLGADA